MVMQAPTRLARRGAPSCRTARPRGGPGGARRRAGSGDPGRLDRRARDGRRDRRRRATASRVELLPTFVGCPALEIIRDAVEQRLGELGRPVQVEVSFATPWTSDRISPDGPREASRLRLRATAAPARGSRPAVLDADRPAHRRQPAVRGRGRTPSPARTAARRERRSRTSSGRPSAARSTTARTAGSRSRRSSRSRRRGPCRPRIPDRFALRTGVGP